jgi:uncharacterized protein YcbX
MTAKIRAIYRYPIKGLSPEPLTCAELWPGCTLKADRSYAIENGPSGFDPAAPAHFPKQRFLMLMRNERLAALDTRFDDADHILTVRRGGAVAAQGDLRSIEGRRAIEAFFAEFSADELRGAPKILHSEGHSFSDVAAKVISIINLASVAEVERIVGAPVDPLRFRGNLLIEGWPAWRELELVGQILHAGPARLKVTKRIVRCAATNVEPGSGRRDMQIPKALMETLGHMDCGVYAEVISGGTIAPGDDMVEAAPGLPIGPT